MSYSHSSPHSPNHLLPLYQCLTILSLSLSIDSQWKIDVNGLPQNSRAWFHMSINNDTCNFIVGYNYLGNRIYITYNVTTDGSVSFLPTLARTSFNSELIPLNSELMNLINSDQNHERIHRLVDYILDQRNEWNRIPNDNKVKVYFANEIHNRSIQPMPAPGYGGGRRHRHRRRSSNSKSRRVGKHHRHYKSKQSRRSRRSRRSR